jgi:hypothetical protein
MCAAQEPKDLKPRDLFYQRDDHAGPATADDTDDGHAQPVRPAQVATNGQRNRTPGRLAVRYQVLRQAGTDFRPVDAARAVFHDGDGIRLTLQSNAACYLYILQRGSSGAWNKLFPQTWMPAEANHLTAYDAADFPASPDLLRFNNEAGTEEVYVVFSPTTDVPVNQLAQASTITEGVPDTQGMNETVMARRDLVFEQVDENAAGVHGPATYVSFRDGSLDGPVILRIRLRHELRPKQ